MLQGSTPNNIANQPIVMGKAVKYFVGTLAAGERLERQMLNGYLYSLKGVTGRIDEIKANEGQSRRNTKARFNVFNCLTRHHLEELHSNFLCYLLNPMESHDCGDSFLKEFYSEIQQRGKIAAATEPLENLRFDCAWVKREHYCGVIEGSRTFIDIYIETPKLIIAIENKINAGEQTDQIKRYAKYCKRYEKKFIVLYLTKIGEKSNTAKDEQYQAIS